MTDEGEAMSAQSFKLFFCCVWRLVMAYDPERYLRPSSALALGGNRGMC